MGGNYSENIFRGDFPVEIFHGGKYREWNFSFNWRRPQRCILKRLHPNAYPSVAVHENLEDREAEFTFQNPGGANWVFFYENMKYYEL